MIGICPVIYKERKNYQGRYLLSKHEATYQRRQFTHQIGYCGKDGKSLVLHAAKFQACCCISAMAAKQLYIRSFYNAP